MICENNECVESDGWAFRTEYIFCPYCGKALTPGR